jgi:hypothetical protein
MLKQFYGFQWSNNQYIQTLILHDGKVTNQTPTGVIYETFDEAIVACAALNRANQPHLLDMQAYWRHGRGNEGCSTS